MKYTMTTPCDACPFTMPRFSMNGLKAHADGEFACHKTCDVRHGVYEPNYNSLHCAGALIFLEKRGKPHQMMRIAERLGMYDRTKLDMKARVR